MSDELYNAVKNLLKVKGRHHTEIAYQRLVDAFDRAPAAPAVQNDTEQNAPWLTLAHAICTDAGVAHGFITDRLNQLRERIGLVGQEPVAWISTNRVSCDKTLAYNKVTSGHDASLYSHDPLYAAPVPAIPPGYALVPIKRSYEMRAAAFLHFNTAEQAGKDRDDAMEAAWIAQLTAAHQPLVSQDVKDAEKYLSDLDFADLFRFYNCSEDFDAGGHDVPKERMKRLEQLGVVRSLGFGRHETTAFGDYLIEAAFLQNPKLPLKTIEEHNAIAAQDAGKGEAK